MSNTTTTMTVRLPTQIRERLDRLAASTNRSRSWLALDAIESYIKVQEWQVLEIEAGIREADAGELATDNEVESILSKWTMNAR